MEEQEDEEEADLDLEAVIKELEDELEKDGMEESENPYDDNEQHDEEIIRAHLVFRGIPRPQGRGR